MSCWVGIGTNFTTIYQYAVHDCLNMSRRVNDRLQALFVCFCIGRGIGIVASKVMGMMGAYRVHNASHLFIKHFIAKCIRSLFW